MAIQHAIRQGDTLYIRIDELHAEAIPQQREAGRIIIARGESTGHAHAITDEGATQYRHPALDYQWVVVEDAPVEVNHEEHETVVLTPGIWLVPGQYQYQRGEVRRVQD